MAAPAGKQTRKLTRWEVDVILEEDVKVDGALLKEVRTNEKYGSAAQQETAQQYAISDADAAAIKAEAQRRASAPHYISFTKDVLEIVKNNPDLAISSPLRNEIAANIGKGKMTRFYALPDADFQLMLQAWREGWETHELTNLEIDVVFEGELKMDQKFADMVKKTNAYGGNNSSKPLLVPKDVYSEIAAQAKDRSAADNYTKLTITELNAILSQKPAIDSGILKRMAKFDSTTTTGNSSVFYWYSNADKASIADAVVAAAASGGGGGKAPAPPKPKVVAAPTIKPGAPAKLSMNYEAALQPFLTEPPILAQVINAGMQRLRQTDSSVQEAVTFVEALLGRRLTFTMADVAPLAAAVRQRIGLKANVNDAKASPSLAKVSVYASLLGQALMWRMRVNALVGVMRAWAKCIAEPRSGPQSTIAKQLVTVAYAEFFGLKPGYAAAGDSKDLFILLAGSPGFVEGSHNLFAAHGDLACDKKIPLVTETDGSGDLEIVIKRMREINDALLASFDKRNDFVDPRKARRLGATYSLLAGDNKTVAKSYGEVAVAFRIHGRLHVKIEIP